MWILFICIRDRCLCMSDVDIIYMCQMLFMCQMWIFMCVRCGCSCMSDVDSIYVWHILILCMCVRGGNIFMCVKCG